VITCSNCGADNPIRQKFCGECGAALAGICTSCGATNPQGQKFCGECGSSLPGEVPPTPSVAVGASQTTPVDERRLVSVLFADLVGFTTLSEGSDAEEVRELLSRYFESSKRLTSLYGGTVEKFIGDAVMSVGARRRRRRTTQNGRCGPRSTWWPWFPHSATRSERRSCEPERAC
jgi:ribosomal protein L40E